jgi:hypothetical protein
MPVLQQHRQNPDQELCDRLKALSEADGDFWAFRGNSKRRHAHAFFQYPAMMVPQMQRELIRAVATARPGIASVFDPFVGSGTTLTESMLYGLRFTGWDINPLAVLLCQAKTGPFYPNALKEKTAGVLGRVAADTAATIETDLPNVRKWFRRDVSLALSKLRRAIRSESALWARRFFWVALADAVRLASNSRTSTFKLHIRPKGEIRARRASPVGLFEEAARRNIEHLEAQCTVLKERGLLKQGRYLRDAETHLCDATRPPASRESGRYDLLISSPPYGDNKSTVPYGQYSYLPLSWIDGRDILEEWDAGWLRTTHEIDTRSLGGVLRGIETADLSEVSPAFRRFAGSLVNAPKDRLQRVAAFCADLNRAIGVIVKEMKPGAYLVWTVGNRRVAGQCVPLDEIMTDLLLGRGYRRVTGMTRPILSKRMAVKNNVSATMQTESVLVFCE